MSRAFVREDSEQQWLHEIPGTVSALQQYLTRENGGIRVTEKEVLFDNRLQKQVYMMSNGLRYARDKDDRWYVV